MTFGPEPFPRRLESVHDRTDYRVTTLTLPSGQSFGAMADVQEPFRIRHETANDEPMGQDDVSDQRSSQTAVTRDREST
jgi:hypothetical protein